MFLLILFCNRNTNTQIKKGKPSNETGIDPPYCPNILYYTIVLTEQAVNLGYNCIIPVLLFLCCDGED